MADFNNPYAPPAAAVADVIPGAGTEFQPVKIFSAKGRIGRLRYFAYLFAANLILRIAALIVGLPIGFALAVSGASRQDITAVSTGITVIFAIPSLIFYTLLCIRRSHDMNLSGWSMLLTFIPLVGLYWLFKSGTQGANRFGPPPPPNSTGVKVLFWTSIVFSVILGSILSAIVFPAYQDYLKRTQAAQSQQLQR